MLMLARVDLGVIPTMYKRNTYRAAVAFDRTASNSARVLRRRTMSPPSLARAQLQAYQHARGVRQIPDNLAQRRRQSPHQRGDRHDLVAARELRVLHQINDLDAILALKVSLANLLEVGERCQRSRCLPRNIEA